MNEVIVRCTKNGISVEGARDIGSTSDTRAGSLSQFLRIAECWWNTYCEKSHRQETGCHGNAAAMREAVDYLCDRLAELDATFDPSEVDCLRAALSAPPRNCDRHTGWLTAIKEFNDTEGRRKPWGDDVYDTRFLDWLFAPAKKEGGEE